LDEAVREKLAFKMCQWKLFLLALFCVIAFGIATLSPDDEYFNLKRWAAIVSSVVLGLRAFFLMAVEDASLRLDSEGFEKPGELIGQVRIRWADIESIRLSWFRTGISIRYKDARYRRVLVIPNLYETPIDELCEKMNEWHARFGRAITSLLLPSAPAP